MRFVLNFDMRERDASRDLSIRCMVPDRSLGRDTGVKRTTAFDKSVWFVHKSEIHEASHFDVTSVNTSFPLMLSTFHVTGQALHHINGATCAQ